MILYCSPKDSLEFIEEVENRIRSRFLVSLRLTEDFKIKINNHLP